MIDSPLNPPIWPWLEEQERISHTRRRVNMLTGRWEQDLHDFLKVVWDTTRAGAEASSLDLSGNLVGSLARQLGIPGLYGVRPAIHGPNPEIIGEGGYLDRAVWCAIMQHVEYMTRGLGCMAVVPEVDAALEDEPCGPLTFRVVTPDLLHVEVNPSRPMEPVRLWELRTRRAGSGSPDSERGKVGYFFDYFDLSDPENPIFAIVSASDVTRDVSAWFGMQTLRGDGYPWRYLSGKPYIPHTFYRSHMADFWCLDLLRGLHRTSYQSARMRTDALFVADNAAFQTGILINANLPGAAQRNANGQTVQTISMVPGAFIVAESMEDQPAQLLTMPAAADPSQMFAAAFGFEKSALSQLGLREDNVTRDAANPTSAAALSIRDGTRREAQVQLAEVFRPSDLVLFRKVTALCEGAALGSFVEDMRDPAKRYSIVYRLIDQSGDAAAAKREDVAFRVANKLMSQIEAYQALNPGADREAAIQALRRVKQDEALLASDPAMGEAEEPEEVETETETEDDGEALMELDAALEALDAEEPDIAAAMESLRAVRELLAEDDDSEEETPEAEDANAEDA